MRGTSTLHIPSTMAAITLGRKNNQMILHTKVRSKIEKQINNYRFLETSIFVIAMSKAVLKTFSGIIMRITLNSDLCV